MTEQRIYRASERGEYDPGPCPKCGGTDVNVDWVDVATFRNLDAWIPGLRECLNAACPSRPQAEDIFA